MPALSGEALAQILGVNADTKAVPIVFHSSNDEDLLRQAVAKHGVLGYVSKGNPATLRSRVAQYLERSRRESS